MVTAFCYSAHYLLRQKNAEIFYFQLWCCFCQQLVCVHLLWVHSFSYRKFNFAVMFAHDNFFQILKKIIICMYRYFFKSIFLLKYWGGPSSKTNPKILSTGFPVLLFVVEWKSCFAISWWLIIKTLIFGNKLLRNLLKVKHYLHNI